MIVEYDSNNSGGHWWLSDEDWFALEKAGWYVLWHKNIKSAGEERWLGALATKAFKEFSDIEEAKREFEKITKQNADAGGCPTCGSPHYFTEAYKDTLEYYNIELNKKSSKKFGKKTKSKTNML